MLLEQFIGATSRGDLAGLESLLSSDVVLYSDGGGKAAALPKPIIGPANVARLMLSSLRKYVPDNVVTTVVQVNGQPGIVSYVDGVAIAVVTIDVVDGFIRNVYVMTNPDKLARIPSFVVNGQAVSR